MNEIFTEIRRMVSDSRMIARNTDYPLYRIAQLKSTLFLKQNSQNKDVCDWWLRLYRNEYSKKDLGVLSDALDRNLDVAEQLEQCS